MAKQKEMWSIHVNSTIKQEEFRFKPGGNVHGSTVNLQSHN